MLARTMAIRHGVGVGFAPCFMAELDPELVRLPVDTRWASAALWVLVHMDTKHVARIRALANHLCTELDALASRLDPFGPMPEAPPGA